jgi:hypothetical protein
VCGGSDGKSKDGEPGLYNGTREGSAWLEYLIKKIDAKIKAFVILALG